jgi:hypothetical protein
MIYLSLGSFKEPLATTATTTTTTTATEISVPHRGRFRCPPVVRRKADLKTARRKFRPGRRHEGPKRKYNYSSTLSLTSTQDGGRWLTSRPGRFTPGKETRCALCGSMSGHQGRWDGCGKCCLHRDSILGPSNP